MSFVALRADKSAVHVASTCHKGITGTREQLQTMLEGGKGTLVVQAKRDRRGPDGKYARVFGPQPRVVADYVKFMGGTWLHRLHKSSAHHRLRSLLLVLSCVQVSFFANAGTDFAGQWRSNGTVQRQSKVWYKALYYFACE